MSPDQELQPDQSPQGATAQSRPSSQARPKPWMFAIPVMIILIAAWVIYSVVQRSAVEPAAANLLSPEPDSVPASAATKTPGGPTVQSTGQSAGQGAAAHDPQERLPLEPLIPETAAGLLQEAERLVGDLATRFPNNPDAHEMHARFHYVFGQVDQALAAWQRCLELDPNYAYALIGLAQAATGRGEHDQAVAYCRRAVLAEPSRPSHQIDLGKALVTAGEIDEALEVLQQVVKTTPDSARAQAELGAAQLQKRDHAAAKVAFEAALRLNPQYATAHFGLATACARLGLAEEAREHEAKFREFRSDRHQELRGQRATYDDERALRADLAVRYSEVASVFVAEGRPALAEQLWRRGARLHPENRECRQALAWLYLGQNKLWEAILLLRELARLEPASSSYPAEIARLFVRLGKPDDAERTLRDFAESAPDSVAGHLALADFYLKVKPKPALAVAEAQKVVKLAETADHWFLLSAAHEMAGDLPAAVEALEHAVRLAPDNLQFRQLLALSKKSRPAVPGAISGDTAPEAPGEKRAPADSTPPADSPAPADSAPPAEAPPDGATTLRTPDSGD
jgi:tetratricopeptide (TPR) repeat protein